MFLAPKILVLMGTPAECLPESIVYFRTYFAGSMGVVMYNIFVGVLQSVGDGRHPLIYLIISSCVNVVLDIFFIAGLGMGVGSALANCYFAVCQCNSLYGASDARGRRIPPGTAGNSF